MKKIIFKHSLFLFLIFGAFSSISAQKNPAFSIGATGGTMIYYGDLTDEYPRVNEHYNEYAYGLQLETALGAKTRLRLAASKGQVRYNDRTLNAKGEFLTDNPNFDRRLNFQTDIQDASLSFVFHSTNPTAFLRPYFTLGFGITKYDVFGDLVDENGTFYNYEEDSELMQDGDFETDLRLFNQEDAFYDETTWHIPVGLGLQFRLAPKLHFNLETNLKYTFTDYLDDVDKRGNDDRWNDIYAYTQAGLVLSFGGGKKNKSAYNAPKIIVGEYAEQSDNPAIPENTPNQVSEPIATIDDAESAVDVANSNTTAGTVSNPPTQTMPARQENASSNQKQAKKASKAAVKNCLQSCDELTSKAERKACKKQCKASKKVDTPPMTPATTTPKPMVSTNTDNGAVIATTDSAPTVPTHVPATTNTIPSPTHPTSSASKDCGDVEQLKIQLAAVQAELAQLKQNPSPTATPPTATSSSSSTYDPVVELYKLEADRLREDNSNTKILHEIQQLRNEVASLKSGAVASTASASQSTTAIPPIVSQQEATTSSTIQNNTALSDNRPTEEINSTTETSPSDVTTEATSPISTEEAITQTEIAPMTEQVEKEMEVAGAVSNKDEVVENEMDNVVKEVATVDKDTKSNTGQSPDAEPLETLEETDGQTDKATSKIAKAKKQKDASSVDCCPEKDKKKFDFFGLFKKKDTTQKQKKTVKKEKKKFDFFGLFKKKDTASTPTNE